jgi:hypothetical protein
MIVIKVIAIKSLDVKKFVVLNPSISLLYAYRMARTNTYIRISIMYSVFNFILVFMYKIMPDAGMF